MMIRKNLINCKLISAKTSGKDYFDSCMVSFRPELEACPCCGRKGDCAVHAYYNRYLIDFIDGRKVVFLVHILRVICSCGATHAILPDPLIPYRSYSLFFVLQVLRDRFIKCMTVEALCEKYDISQDVFLQWRKLFDEHRREWLGTLISMEMDERASLQHIAQEDPYARFARTFFLQTGISFLQSHRNPAPFQRKTRSRSPDFL